MPFKNTQYKKLNFIQSLQLKKLKQQYLKKKGTPLLKRIFNNRVKILQPDLSKPIFVPLQDEGDTNITKFSPFKKMDDFVGYLSKNYPKQQFIVRPHPLFKDVYIGKYNNVEIDPPSNNYLETLNQCGLVMGINSTTLLESALYNKPVIAFGQSIGTGTGVFYDADKSAPPKLKKVKINNKHACAFLYFLLAKVQMKQNKLGDYNYIMKSRLFDLLQG